MIAMQYSFTLPADYDMTIIDRRIREKGPLLDGFPHLLFKTYLSARKHSADLASTENLYAPFYLWDEPDGIDSFLSSPGFAALTRDFGWPSVQTWLVWAAERAADLRAARYAARTIAVIAPYSDLAACRDTAIAEGRSAMRNGALASLAGFDPTQWRMLHFTLWETVPVATEATQTYEVGHIALPKP
ncbi:DUF4865 family protein [Segnochrobactrum spirostomi]|uniref:DUF4865 family protein n=1 Tax=Segnochrobactrum spirostomi TaxID=2608987 RepID=A0A6A7Y9F7_9HYPH|nr:DUF4865 family protein [Segnochrobactrum spirostomi]MQT14282.1 DUF4865 family protein [Segnochrobactrum spirostomi]